jgi:hypothetical protein
MRWTERSRACASKRAVSEDESWQYIEVLATCYFAGGHYAQPLSRGVLPHIYLAGEHNPVPQRGF